VALPSLSVWSSRRDITAPVGETAGRAHTPRAFASGSNGPSVPPRTRSVSQSADQMRKSSHAVCLGIALSISAVVGAAAPIETKQVTVTPSAPADPVAPGARVSLAIDVTPKRMMHVYAPQPKGSVAPTRAAGGSRASYIPVSLTIEADPAITVSIVKFPNAELLRDPLDEPQLVYSKPFRIVQDVTIAATPALRARARAPGAAVTIKGTLRYQACDDTICYVPVNVPVSWTVPLHGSVR
jgi:hypothetical protein